MCTEQDTKKAQTEMENSTEHDSQPQEEEVSEEKTSTFLDKIIAFYWDNEFLILIVCAILLARAYPPLGADYLYPEITATWIAVCFIFILAGLGLKTEEFSNALQQFRFNVIIQLFNFGIVSASVYGLSRGLQGANILSDDLADGMVVCASLPMTINMVLVLTKASGGDEAAAIFNAAAGNLVGVFLSPVLILGYLGVTGDVEIFEIFYKLALRVVLPVVVGQLMHRYSPAAVAFNKKHKSKFKRAQMFCLVFIVYTVFCRTFEKESQSSIGDIFLTILFQFLSLTSLMFVAWNMLKVMYPNDPKLRVMGLYGCTHKTVAMGVPLINAIYEDNPAVGLYTLPLLIWHPMQLVIGTFLSPRLATFVEREEERLGLKEESEEEQADEPAASEEKV